MQKNHKFPVFFMLILIILSLYTPFVYSSANNQELTLILYGERGCAICERVKTVIVPALAKKHNVKFKITEYLADRHLDTYNALVKKYNFNPRALPVLFVSDRPLAGRIEIEENLEKTIIDFKEKRLLNKNIYEGITTADVQSARNDVITNFKKWSLGTVIVAGLIDGINPCAFATIIFLISYLAYVGKKRRDVIIIALIYTFSVFITYLVVGVIFYNIIDKLSHLHSVISSIIFYITLSLCVFFSVFTLYDFIKALKKKTDEMALTLPKKFKQKIHKVIREKLKMRGLIISSIIIGFLVSMFELACTGQVYLPTIMFVLHNSPMKSTGFLYLVIYNLAFILPLVIIFLLNLLGVSSERLQKFLQKNVALTKLLLFILFIIIIAYLIIDRYVL